MSVVILGGKGNMGQRYSTIHYYTERPCLIADRDTPTLQLREYLKSAEGVIIATPTDTHVDMIRFCLPYGIPILCEKPITKDLRALKDLMKEVSESNSCLSMIYQYKFMMDKRQRGPSYYNYYKHGTDGLIWDCIQIIGLAKDSLTLGDDSPIWKCMINGKLLDLGRMDHAYINFINDWYRNPGDDLEEILDVHEKTAEIERTTPHVRAH